MYCLYRLDVIIPGATIKPQSQKSVHNMTTSVDDTEPFDYTTIDVPAVKTSRQDGVGVTWDKPHKDENIDSVSSWLMLIIALTAKSVFTQTLQLTWSVKWLLYSQPSQSLHRYYSLVEVSSDCCTHSPVSLYSDITADSNWKIILPLTYQWVFI